MFPEYRDLISRLKNENPRFMSLFDKHNKLERDPCQPSGEIGKLPQILLGHLHHPQSLTGVFVEQLKDEMLKILQQESVKEV